MNISPITVFLFFIFSIAYRFYRNVYLRNKIDNVELFIYDIALLASFLHLERLISIYYQIDGISSREIFEILTLVCITLNITLLVAVHSFSLAFEIKRKSINLNLSKPSSNKHDDSESVIESAIKKNLKKEKKSLFNLEDDKNFSSVDFHSSKHLMNRRLDPKIFKKTDRIDFSVPKDFTEQKTQLIHSFFESFNINAKVLQFRSTCSNIFVDLTLGKGVKTESLLRLENDMSCQFALPVKIILHNSLPVLEMRREDRQVLTASYLFSSIDFDQSKNLDIVLGYDSFNKPYKVNLTSMPHMLVAGTTGSGKSVVIHSIIASLLLSTPASILKFIMVDPKIIELSVYKDLPNLCCPIIYNEFDTVEVIEQLVEEMEERYKLLSQTGLRSVEEYNLLQVDLNRILPYIVLIIDEFGDLMLGDNGKTFERNIIKLAQKSRAAGICMILVTQRPSAEIFTGLLKSNIPARLACKVASKIDSRIILNYAGAENLLGMGDMLFYQPGLEDCIRIQAPYLNSLEIKNIVKSYLKQNKKSC